MQFSFTRSVSYLEKSSIAFGPITKVIILNLIKSSIKQKDLLLVIQYSNQLLIKSMDGRTTKLINTHGFVDSPLIFCKALTYGQEDSVLFLESQNKQILVGKICFNAQAPKEFIQTIREFQFQQVFIFQMVGDEIYIMDETLKIKIYSLKDKEMKYQRELEFSKAGKQSFEQNRKDFFQQLTVNIDSEPAILAGNAIYQGKNVLFLRDPNESHKDNEFYSVYQALAPNSQLLQAARVIENCQKVMYSIKIKDLQLQDKVKNQLADKIEEVVEQLNQERGDRVKQQVSIVIRDELLPTKDLSTPHRIEEKKQTNGDGPRETERSFLNGEGDDDDVDYNCDDIDEVPEPKFMVPIQMDTEQDKSITKEEEEEEPVKGGNVYTDFFHKKKQQMKQLDPLSMFKKFNTLYGETNLDQYTITHCLLDMTEQTQILVTPIANSNQQQLVPSNKQNTLPTVIFSALTMSEHIFALVYFKSTHPILNQDKSFRYVLFDKNGQFVKNISFKDRNKQEIKHNDMMLLWVSSNQKYYLFLTVDGKVHAYSQMGQNFIHHVTYLSAIKQDQLIKILSKVCDPLSYREYCEEIATSNFCITDQGQVILLKSKGDTSFEFQINANITSTSFNQSIKAHLIIENRFIGVNSLNQILIKELEPFNGNQNANICYSPLVTLLKMNLDPKMEVLRIMMTKDKDLIQVIVKDDNNIMSIITWNIAKNIEHSALQFEMQEDYNEYSMIYRGASDDDLNTFSTPTEFFELKYNLPSSLFQTNEQISESNAYYRYANEVKISLDRSMFLGNHDRNSIYSSSTLFNLVYHDCLQKEGDIGGISKLKLDLAHFHQQYEGNTLLHNHFDNFDFLENLFSEIKKEFVDEKQMNEQNKLIILLLIHKNKEGVSPFDLVMELQKTKLIEHMLEMLTFAPDYVVSPFIKQYFPQLFQKRLFTFEKYIETCSFTNHSMERIQYAVLKQDEMKCLGTNTSISTKGIIQAEEKQNPDALPKGDYLNFSTQSVNKAKRVQVLAVEFDWIFDVNSCKSFFNFLASTSANQTLFQNETITTIITYIWSKIFYKLLWYGFIPFVFYLASFSVYVTFIHEQYVQDQESVKWYALDIAFIVLSLIFILWFAIVEIRQLLNEGVSYFLSIWNVNDFLSLILNITFIVSDLCSANQYRIRILGTMCIICLWFKFFYFLRLFRPTQSLIKMIVEVVKDMVIFSLILAAAVLGCANVFYILAVNASQFDAENADPGMASSEDLALFTGDNFLAAIIYSFNIGIGSADTPYDGKKNQGWMWLFYIFEAVVIQIILLNLLISIIGETYGRMRETRVQSEFQSICQMISDQVRFIDNRILTDTRYILVVKQEAIMEDTAISQEQQMREELQLMMKMTKYQMLQCQEEMIKSQMKYERNIQHKMDDMLEYQKEQFKQLIKQK